MIQVARQLDEASSERIAGSVAARFTVRNPSLDRDELEQVARIAIWKAQATYRPGGLRLENYAWQRARYEVLEHLRAARGRVHSMAAVVPFGDGRDPVDDRYPPDRFDEREELVRAAMARSFKRLGQTPCWRRIEVMVLRLVHGLKFREIGERIGFSTERAHQHYRECLPWIRASPQFAPYAPPPNQKAHA